MKVVINVVFVITLLGVINVYAQTCNDNVYPATPSERFIDNGDGTVSDKQTGLVWMRCSLGQTWDDIGQACTGTALEYNWQQALQAAQGYVYAGSNAWRVPDKNQLLSIVEISCGEPAINLDIFPQTPDFGIYWTSSSNAVAAGVGSYYWGVGFQRGSDNPNYHWSDSVYVRLVRPSQ